MSYLAIRNLSVRLRKGPTPCAEYPLTWPGAGCGGWWEYPARASR